MSSAVAVTDLVVEKHEPSRTTLVNHVNLGAEAGHITGVVGETGAGKTLTMRALLGLLPAGLHATGRLALNGDDVDLEDVTRLRSLLGESTSVVLQNPSSMLDPLMRVGDQIVEGVLLRGLQTRAEALERAAGLLTSMGFADPEALQRLYPHELSGGMAQRVVTAIGLMSRPRLLVLDEPTSALDANVRVEVLTLFRRIAEAEQTAVFLVSHDLGLVSHFCEGLVVMYSGQVVEAGPAARVLERPRHPYTSGLLRCSPRLDAVNRAPLSVIPGTPPRPGNWPDGCVFAPRCPLVQPDCHTRQPSLAEGRDHPAACFYSYLTPSP
jgi:oligopeptide/dipeptide ABC transporter ATP-binding protein